MHAHYGLDLSAPGILDRISWRWLRVRVAALPADSALASVLRARRKAGDVIPDEILESDADADQFWRRRAGKRLRGEVH